MTPLRHGRQRVPSPAMSARASWSRQRRTLPQARAGHSKMWPCPHRLACPKRSSRALSGPLAAPTAPGRANGSRMTKSDLRARTSRTERVRPPNAPGDLRRAETALPRPPAQGARPDLTARLLSRSPAGAAQQGPAAPPGSAVAQRSTARRGSAQRQRSLALVHPSETAARAARPGSATRRVLHYREPGRGGSWSVASKDPASMSRAR